MRYKSFSLELGASIFKAFSEEARVRILFLLYKNGEMCISDLEHILDFTQTKTSRHLAYLKNAGILNTKKRDQWRYFEIKEEFMGIAQHLFSYLEKDNVLLEDLNNFNTLYANNVLAIRKFHNKKNIYNLPELS